MYNSVINDWKDVEHQIPFDVRQPKTHAYTMRRLREYLESHPYVNVVRFTTFFHLFTLVFDELRREKYVDWYGYSASVSPYILEQFEKEVGYKFRPECIIDQGYYNNQYRVPTKEYKDFQAFQRREVAGLMKEMTDIVHAYGKEAMMFLGELPLRVTHNDTKPTTLTRTGRVANTKLIVELFFCTALRKDHLLIVVGRGKVRLEHDIVEQLLAGCEQNIDLRTPGIMLGL